MWVRFSSLARAVFFFFSCLWNVTRNGIISNERNYVFHFIAAHRVFHVLALSHRFGILFSFQLTAHFSSLLKSISFPFYWIRHTILRVRRRRRLCCLHLPCVRSVLVHISSSFASSGRHFGLSKMANVSNFHWNRRRIVGTLLLRSSGAQSEHEPEEKK